MVQYWMQKAPIILEIYGTWVGLACAFLLFGLGWVLGSWVKARRIPEIEHQIERRKSKLVEKEDRERKAVFLEEKNKWYSVKGKFERELDQKRVHVDKLNEEFLEKENRVATQIESVRQRGRDLKRREREVRKQEVRLGQRDRDLENLLAENRAQLEQISGMNSDHAKEMLLDSLKIELKRTSISMGREIVDQAKAEAEREAKKILALAIERCSTDQTVQSSISVVPLPDDEIKGRIVGKEGRNIISFEAATGVKVIVNDTPEAVVLSSFDPIKRDIARLALEQLVKEGRISPSRVEEVVLDCEKQVRKLMEDDGRQVVKELGIGNMHQELIKLLGRLKYRTSYGQSVLRHSKEVAFLASAMAAELRLDERLARRAALLHDIGKAVDQHQEGTHTSIGVLLTRKYGEGQEVENAILYHHGDAEATTPISFLVKAADAISSSRPGARRDDLEGYIKRVQNLEEVAQSFPGVRDAYAINAGREVRVMVNAGRIKDEDANVLSFEIAQRIREEMTYPGQIQITVIRQTVATEWVGRTQKKRKNRSKRKGERRYDKSRSRNDADGKNVSSSDHKGAVIDLQTSARKKDNHAVSRGNLGETGRLQRVAQANKG